MDVPRNPYKTSDQHRAIDLVTTLNKTLNKTRRADNYFSMEAVKLLCSH